MSNNLMEFIMPDIDWEKVWKSAIGNSELFPAKLINKNTLSVSCPTRFSNSGEMSIEITPTFNDASISLELLLFNDNIDVTDILSKDEQDKESIKKAKSISDFNMLAAKLVQYELQNRISDRFLIKSKGFNSDKEAENALIDYINSKATESGRMFDDKLDELNDAIETGERPTMESIREKRAFILRKIEGILRNHYCWKSSKNEDFSDSVAECYDDNDNLMAVISLVDDCVVVDLAKGISAKVSLLQSDEEIEHELCTDVEVAKEVIADKEIDQLKDVVAGNLQSDKSDVYEEPTEPDEQEEYIADLEKRLARLESLYINRKFKRLY